MPSEGLNPFHFSCWPSSCFHLCLFCPWFGWILPESPPGLNDTSLCPVFGWCRILYVPKSGCGWVKAKLLSSSCSDCSVAECSSDLPLGPHLHWLLSIKDSIKAVVQKLIWELNCVGQLDKYISKSTSSPSLHCFWLTTAPQQKPAAWHMFWSSASCFQHF